MIDMNIIGAVDYKLCGERKAKDSAMCPTVILTSIWLTS